MEEKKKVMGDILETTKLLHKTVKEDKIDEINNILDKRQTLIENLTAIDARLKDSGEKNSDEQLDKLKEEIIALDKESKIAILKKGKELKEAYNSLDQKIKMGNLEISKEDIKPAGYFLNTKK